MFTGRVREGFTPRDKPKVIGYCTTDHEYRWLHISRKGLAIEFTKWSDAIASVRFELTRQSTFGEKSIYERKEVPGYEEPNAA